MFKSCFNILCENILKWRFGKIQVNLYKIKEIDMDDMREALDELMGRNRNQLNHTKARNAEHYSDRDVCKYNLVSFCPHDLFPNTKKDLGPYAKISL